jgi:TP901 family phage tail tape measure protein
MAETTNRRISIFIDTAQGQGELAKLQAQEARLLKSTEELKKGTKAWINEMRLLEKTRADISQLEQQLSGKLGPTTRQLQKEAKALRNELAGIPVELQAASAAGKRLKQVEAALDSVKNKARQTTSVFGDMKKMIVAAAIGVAGGSLATAGMQMAGSFVSGSIEMAAKMSDQLADVRKTTGMTVQEVAALNKEFGKVDTRTATSELRNMAIVAGQFGIPKDQILGFVEAVDKINIALGDEFTGGAQQIAEEMSKLRNIFKDVRTDNVGLDIQHISNALNELGAAGVATGPVVADFANRIGGIGIPLGLTTGEVLGLSATLQELNVNAERGGTAVSKILQKMLTNTKGFAEIAGKDVKVFTKLLNEDLFGAFKAVMEGSNKSGKSSTALANIIKELELSGAGASEVFSKLGGNIDLLDRRVTLSNEALTNTVSITNEWAIKNDNLAGSIEKLEKKWTKLIHGSGGEAFFKMMVDGASASIDALKSWGFMVTDILNPILAFKSRIAAIGAEIEEDAKKNFEKRQEAQYQYTMQVRKMNDDQLQNELIAQSKIAMVHLAGAREMMRQNDQAGFVEQKRLFNNAQFAIRMIKDVQAAHAAAKGGKEFVADDKAAKKALDDFKRLQEEIKHLQEQAYLHSLSENEREIKAIQIKYSNLLERAKGHVRELRQLRDLEYQETVNALNKQAEAARKVYNHDMVEYIKKEKEKNEKLREEREKRMTAAYQTLVTNAEIATKFARNDDERTREQQKKLLLQAQMRRDTEEHTAEEMKLIWAETYEAIDKLDADLKQRQIERGFAMAQESMNILEGLVQYNNQQRDIEVQAETDKTTKLVEQAEREKQRDLQILDQENKSGLMKTDNYTKRKEDIEKRYTMTTAKLNEDLEAKKRRAAHDAASNNKAIQMASAAINGAASVVTTMAGTPYPANLILAALQAVAVGVQLAIISSTPIPEAARGGNTLDVVGAQSGKTYPATYVGSIAKGGRYSRASLGIVGEEGAELVIPNWMYTHPKMVDTMGALESMIGSRQIQYAAGGPTTSTTGPVPSFGGVGEKQLVMMLAQNNALMQAVITRMNQPLDARITYDMMTTALARAGAIESAQA